MNRYVPNVLIVSRITLILFSLLSLYTTSWATTYYNTPNTDPSVPANWTTTAGGGGTAATNFTTSGDLFIVSGGTNAQFPNGGAYNWTIGPGVTLQVDGGISYRNGGTKTITINGTIIFTNATVNQLVNGSSTATFTLSSGATLITANSAGIVGTGTQSISNTVTTVALNTGANYEFNRAGAQTMTGIPTTVNNLTLSGSGAKTFPGAMTINGNLTFSGTASNSGTGIGALAIAGNVVIGTGTTFISGSFTHTVGGNWTNSGTFTATGSTIDFNGAGASNIGASNFNNITFSGAGTKTATGALTIAGNATISNNFTAGALTHTVGGNWTRTGTFTATGSTIDFNGAGAGSIGASNFNNITFSGAGAKTATGALTIAGNVSLTNNFSAGAFSHTVAGNWTNNGGTLTANTSTITFNGATQTINGPTSTTFNNLTISSSTSTTLAVNTSVGGNLSVTTGIYDLSTFTSNRTAAGGTLSISAGATLKIGGTNSMPSNFSTKTFNATSTVEYNGTNQTVTAETYGNLIFSNSGTKTLPAATTTVVGNFTTNGTASTSAATFPLNVNGNVTLNSSGAFNAGTATHEVWGSWYKNNAGAFTPSTSTIIFTNTSNPFETVGGTQDNTFYNATIDGTTLSLGSNFTVSNTLTLNSKLLYLNNLNATLSSASGLNWTGGGDSYIVTNGSGRFIRTIGAAGTYNFPLGDFIPGGSVIGTDNTRFNPAVMTWGSAPGVTSVSSHFSSAVLGAPSGLTAMIYGGSGATPITSFLNNGYWDFTAVGTTSNYDLTLTTDGVTNMGSLTGMHAIFRNTSTGASGWGLGGGSAAPLNVWGSLTNSTAGFGGVISPQTKNASQFGFFGIGRSDNAYVLPIVLVAFDGTNVGNANVLSWSTASEINNDYFTIERSLDGQNYEDIGTIEGAGQSSQVLNYTFTDDQPFLGTNYYRLKQTDYNGQFDYSPVISLKVTSSFEMGYPYPNPVLNKVNMNINSTASGLSSITIYDMAGREMYNNIITVNEGIQTIGIDMSNFASGMYISEIMVDGVPYRNTILKQ